MNHSLAGKLATDLLLRSLGTGRLFLYRKFMSSLSLSGIRAFTLMFF